jgi:GT2 family glycosyltransferase
VVDVGLVIVADSSLTLADEIEAVDGNHDFVAFVRREDTILDGGLDELRAAIAANPRATIVYGDEIRRLDGADRPFYKPAWSPQRLRCQHLLSGLVAYAAGPLQTWKRLLGPGATTMSELHDLALLASEHQPNVVHVPFPLAYIGGSEDSRKLDPEVASRHFQRSGLPIRGVSNEHGSHLLSFAPALSRHPVVSIIVPTGGAQREVGGRVIDLVDNAIVSVLEQTLYPNFEIVVVVDQHSSHLLAERLIALSPDRIRVVKDERPFNFAAAVNLGVEHAQGEVVLLLNDDTAIIEPSWLERLVALSADDGVGAVGAKLLYGDGRVQHAGVTIRHGRADHTYRGYPGGTHGHGDELAVPINVSSTTGACLLVRRDHWEVVGGMTERFPLNYNDVDLCLKLADRGWRTVVDNTTALMHLETSSRPQGSETWEDAAFAETWPGAAALDPYDSPNFVDLGVEHVPKPHALVRLERARNGRPVARCT